MNRPTQFLAGERRRLAREISAAERGVVGRSGPARGTFDAHVVGLTGPPGVGKSSLIDQLIGGLRRRGRTVGVLAVDPSSPVSGGSVLGDRLRMASHVGDPAVFIRSVASRGELGGTGPGVPLALDVLESAGFDVVLVETVGVGQSEVGVADLADTTVWCTAPGLGDEVQAVKAGVLEVADVLVVNKADLPGASTVAADLVANAWRRDAASGGGWEVEVHSTCARDGSGVDGLVDALDRHLEAVDGGGVRSFRRARRAELVLRAAAHRWLDQRLGGVARSALVDALEEVRSGADLDDVVGGLLGGCAGPAAEVN